MDRHIKTVVNHEGHMMPLSMLWGCRAWETTMNIYQWISCGPRSIWNGFLELGRATYFPLGIVFLHSFFFQKYFGLMSFDVTFAGWDLYFAYTSVWSVIKQHGKGMAVKSWGNHTDDRNEKEWILTGLPKNNEICKYPCVFREFVWLVKW